MDNEKEKIHPKFETCTFKPGDKNFEMSKLTTSFLKSFIFLLRNSEFGFLLTDFKKNLLITDAVIAIFSYQSFAILILEENSIQLPKLNLF